MSQAAVRHRHCVCCKNLAADCFTHTASEGRPRAPGAAPLHKAEPRLLSVLRSALRLLSCGGTRRCSYPRTWITRSCRWAAEG